MRGRFGKFGLVLAILVVAQQDGASRAQELAVVSVSPTKNGLNAGLDAAISIEFDRPVDPTTLTPANFAAFGRWSGHVGGTFQLSNGNKTVTLRMTTYSFQEGPYNIRVGVHTPAESDQALHDRYVPYLETFQRVAK